MNQTNLERRDQGSKCAPTTPAPVPASTIFVVGENNGPFKQRPYQYCYGVGDDGKHETYTGGMDARI